MILKDGSNTQDEKLDRLYELDWRSLNYPVSAVLQKATSYKTNVPKSAVWALDRYLDQGQEGACVGFAFAHEMLATPQTILSDNGMPIDAKYARDRIYWEAQKIDEWVGGSYPSASPFYEGTSVLSGAKILAGRGFYKSYHWALNLQEMVDAVGYLGPVVLGCNWYTGMYDTNAQGYIRPTGQLVGGHAILVRGVKIVYKNTWSRFFKRTWANVDLAKSYFILHNSWGQSWGQSGRAMLSLTDAQTLLNQQGDVCLPVRA